MNQEDINFEDGPTATTAAFIFHIIIVLLILIFEDTTTATFYLVTSLITATLLHYLVFVGFLVELWPKSSFNTKNETSLSRLVTTPFMAILNVVVAYAFVFVGFLLALFAGAFKKAEGVIYKQALDFYESTKHTGYFFTKPEHNDSASTAFYYLQSQLTSVLDFGIVGFTVFSIIALILLEILTLYIRKYYK